MLRMQWFDAAVFGVVATILCVDLIRGVSRSDWGASRIFAFRRRWVWAAAAVVGIIACLLPRHSLSMQVLVCVTGVTALGFAWMQGRGSLERWTSALRRLAWVWGALVVLGCLWELFQFIVGLLRPQSASFALSDLLNPLLTMWPGQVAFVLLWLAFGGYLLRRGPS